MNLLHSTSKYLPVSDDGVPYNSVAMTVHVKMKVNQLKRGR